MGNSGNRFDRYLLDHKLQPLSRKMQGESMESDRAAIRTSRETAGGSLLVKTVEGQLMVLRKWLEGVDQICREVWQTQGEAISPDFVRGTLVPKASELIAAREGTIKRDLELKVRRGAVQPWNRDVYRANHHLAMEIIKLKAEVANRYEIEARELEYRNAPTKETKPMPAFDHSDDYRSVTIRGQNFTLTSRQAQIIQILDQSRQNGFPDVSKDYLLEELGTKNSRLLDSFKSNLPAWKELVKTGAKRGTLRLNV